MLARPVAAWFALGCALVLTTSSDNKVTAAGKDRRFSSARHGVSVDAPAGWTLSLHTGYPSIIALLLHPTGSRISFAVAETTAITAAALIEQNRPGLQAQGLIVDRITDGVKGGAMVDAHGRARDEALRQYYLVRPVPKGARQALVVTLTTKKDLLASMGPSLDLVLAHMTLESPAVDESTASGGVTSRSRADGSAD